MTLAGGRYVDRLERRDGRWAIVDRVCVAEWNAESTSLITDEVIAMMPDVHACGSMVRTDPSYDPSIDSSLGQHPERHIADEVIRH
mgnify:CR=1 FL=1